PQAGPVAVGDFNRDGKLDLVTSGGSLLLNNGNGTFHASRSFALGTTPTAVAIGDFNGDRILDLVVAKDESRRLLSPINGAVSILLGKGDGTFGAVTDYAVGVNPASVVVGDFNGDGILDLAVANRGPDANAPGTVSILLGKGDGTFGPAQTYAAG